MKGLSGRCRDFSFYSNGNWGPAEGFSRAVTRPFILKDRSCFCFENRFQAGKSRHGDYLEALVINQVGYDGGMHQVVAVEGGRCGQILKIFLRKSQ